MQVPKRPTESDTSPPARPPESPAESSTHDFPNARPSLAIARGARRDRARARIAERLATAGVRIDGAAPHDLRVHDPALFARVFAHGSLGLGEAYMDGWWDADDLPGFLYRVLDARLDLRVGGIEDAALSLRSRLRNLQRGRRAYIVGEKHYDLGNDLFEAMLGRRLVYSCGYWRRAEDLDAAQEAKLDLVCRKLGLVPGMRVLDIGCGWGEALKFAAERYGVHGVGITSRTPRPNTRDTCAPTCRSKSGCRTTANSTSATNASFPSACSSTSARKIIAPTSKRCAAVWRRTG